MPKKKITKKIVKKPIRKVVKKIVKKTLRAVKKPKPVSKKKVVAQKIVKPEQTVGVVTHYFNHIKVAIVKIKEPIMVGDTVAFRGATTDFLMPVKSMQFDHKSITIAKKKQEIGVKVPKRVRQGDVVYRKRV
jgi:hypothetical protein